MKKISGSTIFFKKLYPTLWFGFLLIIIILTIFKGNFSDNMAILFALLFMALVVFIVFKAFVWDLADEVYDCGEYLEYRKSGKTQIVYLKDIINISYSHFSSPPRIEILIPKSNGVIGEILAFNPPLKLNPFVKSLAVKDLIERVNNARNT